MTTNRYQCAATGNATTPITAGTAIKGKGMIDMFAGAGKDLLSPDGTMRAKRVTTPATATLWTEVDELPPEVPVV